MGIFTRLKAAGAALLGPRSKTLGVGLRAALATGQPGTWATDHSAEAGHVKDWMYIAIRAICLQGAQAEVQVYDDSRPETKTWRKSLRQQARTDAALRKSLYAGEQEVGRPLNNESRVMRLYKRPNPGQSGALFRYEQILNLQATGTCLVWNVPSKLGTTCERYVIPTAMARPVRDGWRVDPGAYALRFPNLGDDGYAVTGTFGQILGKVLPTDQVQVIRWPHPFVKDDGYSPIGAGGALVETGEHVTQARYAQLVNGVDPSLLVLLGGEDAPPQDELDAAAAKLNEKYAGANNRRKAIVMPGLGPGGSVTTLSHTAADMDFASGFADYRNAALALQGTPPVAAGIQEAGAYAAYYASLRQFMDLTVQPILDVLAESDTEHFLPQFGAHLTCEIEASPIDDPSITEQQLATDIAAGAVTVDEVRSLRGRKPFGGARGDRLAGAQQAPTWLRDTAPAPTQAPRPGLFQRPAVPGPGTTRPAQESQQPAAAAQSDAAPENVASTQALNGAQITAAKDVLAGVSDGSVAPVVAEELLIAVGIAQDRAHRMVQAATQTPAGDDLPEPVKSRINGSKSHA